MWRLFLVSCAKPLLLFVNDQGGFRIYHDLYAKGLVSAIISLFHRFE